MLTTSIRRSWPLVALLLAGCNASTDLFHPDIPPPNDLDAPWTLKVRSLVDSVLVAGTPVSDLAEVEVRNASGEPVVDAFVMLSFLERPTGYEEPFTGRTDSLGRFTFSGWVAGPTVGNYVLRVGTQSDILQVQDTMTVRVIADAPANLSCYVPEIILPAGWQSGAAYRVRDRYENPNAGIPVAMERVAGEATLRLGVGDVTDTSGIAWGMVIAAPHADVTDVRGTTPVLPDSSALCRIRTLTPAAGHVVSGDDQVVAPGAVPSIAWRVHVVDSAGNGVAGLPMGIEAPGSSQSFRWTTDSLGDVTITPPPAPMIPGSYAYKIIAIYFLAADSMPTFHVQVPVALPPGGTTGNGSPAVGPLAPLVPGRPVLWIGDRSGRPRFTVDERGTVTSTP